MEIKIDKPTKYADSFIFRKETGFEYYVNGNDHFLNGDATKQELLAAFDDHNPSAPAEASISEKLVSVGLSIDDLKIALGI